MALVHRGPGICGPAAFFVILRYSPHAGATLRSFLGLPCRVRFLTLLAFESVPETLLRRRWGITSFFPAEFSISGFSSGVVSGVLLFLLFPLALLPFLAEAFLAELDFTPFLAVGFLTGLTFWVWGNDATQFRTFLVSLRSAYLFIFPAKDLVGPGNPGGIDIDLVGYVFVATS